MLPLPPLTPEEMLATLEDMNVQLHIRLTLHEDLPHYLCNWRCANGRATFTFPGEFEFDVTISDEDPSVQLWFVDLRFLFTPTISLPDGEARLRLQDGADRILKESGLPACADYLRNFVLTHQITILRNQSMSLIRGSWKSAMKVEAIHRSLVIQYWMESPFAKSWLEIGISSGKENRRLIPGRLERPKITSKWKRYGEYLPEGELDLQLQHLSIDGIIRRAISQHTSHVLRTARDMLRNSARESLVFSLDLMESHEEPVDCKLLLQLGVASPKITFSIEQFTGRLTIQPATALSGRAEYDLNRKESHGPPRNPTQEVAGILETYVCLDMIWRIERQAAFSGWEQVTNLRLTLDHLREVLGCKPIRWGFFKPTRWSDWSKNWILCVTINLDGCAWWAVELNSTAERPSISAFQSLPVASKAFNNLRLDATLLRRMEDEASRSITEFLATQHIRQRQTKFEGVTAISADLSL
jgi:mediator of RNA polymerase II transcription subunit 14